MNYQEFAQTIKKKYPAYQNIDDKELVNRFVTKYPVYKSKLDTVDTAIQTPTPIQQPIEQPTQKPKAKKGTIGSILEALTVPEKMSREGWDKIAKALPEAGQTRNVVANFAMGVPRVLAETARESAPGFVSRGSILTAGALKSVKPAKALIKGVGKALAKGAESVSGLEYKTPGVLTEAFKNPKLFFSDGTKKAGQEFKKFFDEGKIRPELQKLLTNKQVVSKTLKYAEAGDLTPEEALLGRRSLDVIKKEIAKQSYNFNRSILDTVAKTKSAFADVKYAKAVKADALRTLFATNKGGGTSIAKLAVGSLGGFLPNVGMSPAVQGLTATGLGAINKVAKPAKKLVDILAQKPFQSGATIASILKLKEKFDKKNNR